MAIHFNLKRAAELELSGKCHSLHVGDSQSSQRTLGLWQYWPTFNPQKFHYFVAGGPNTTTSALCSGAGFGGNNIDAGNVRTDTSYGALTAAGTMIRPTRGTDFTAGTGDGSNFSNGIQLNRLCVGGGDPNSRVNQGAPWPQWPGHDEKPWYHGGRIKAKGIYMTCTDELPSHDYRIFRTGVSATNNSASYKAVTFTGTTIKEGPWTDPHLDTGTYDTTGAIPNDHDLQLRLSASGGHDESLYNLLVLAAIFARCDASGVIPWNADNTGYGYDFFGVSGSNAIDWDEEYADQALWQEHHERTVLVPDKRTVGWFMLGHNYPAEYDASTNAVDAALHYANFINKVKAAHDAAFPSGEFVPVMIVPWRNVVESTKMSTLARCDAYQAACEAQARANGFGFFSFYEYFAQTSPFNQLHPESLFDVSILCLALRDTLDRVTNGEYSPLGRVLTGGGARSRAGVR